MIAPDWSPHHQRALEAATDACITAREALADVYDRMAECVRRGDPLPHAMLKDAREAFDDASRALLRAEP